MKSTSYQFICVVIHVVISSHYICLISASCAMPEPITNTITTLPNQTLDTGSYITWECSVGYMMDGLTNTVVWVCLEDGSWLGHTPICTAIKCPSPPIAAYSKLDPPLSEAPVVNQTISYRCSSSSEYTLLGSNLSRCLQDGTWENDPPVCQRDCDATVSQVKRYSNLTCYRRRGGIRARNWINSLNLCNLNGELLATVKDNKTQTFLVEFIGDHIGNSVWIGAMEGRDWMWRRSNEYIERFFWHEAFPESHKDDCIALSYHSATTEFTWNPSSPDNNNGVLCQFDKSCQNAGLDQSEMVLDYMGNCFQFLNVSKNYSDGGAECSDRDGFLTEILDESTNDLLVKQALYLKENTIVGENTAWWIGGYDDDSLRSWYWVDKTRVIYEAWDSGTPNNNNHDCVEMRKNNDYEWDDSSCTTATRQTLCQIGIPACGDPGEPLHGNRLPDDRTTYSVDATLQFTCQEGYTLSGESIIRCMNNGLWNYQRPSCEAVKCEGSPSNVTLASIMILGSVYQNIALYTCQEGFIPDNEPISFCQHTGNWSTPNFTCLALSPCYSNPCINGGTCYEVDGSSFTCTCTPNYTGSTCDGEIMLTTSLTFTTQASPQSTESKTESPKGNSLPSGVVAAGSSVVILFILVVFVLTTVLFRRRRAAKPVLPDDENEMENYAAVANCYEDSKPTDRTPQDPYYLTLEPDSDQNGGFGTSVAEQPSPHLWKGVTQDDTPSVMKGSNGWNETDTEDGFVDNVLYGTRDEETVRPSSSNHISTDHKAAKHHAITTTHQGPGRPKPGNPKSGATETDEDAYEGYEDEKVMVDNELYGAPSPITPRAHKHAVADQENDAVYENPDGNVYESYEEEDSMVDNELYGAVTPPTSRADNTNDLVVGEGDGEMYQNTEFHSVPTNLIANEFYKSVDEI